MSGADQLKHPHAAEALDALRLLDAHAGGLSSAEAERRLAEFGPNLLPQAKQRSAIIRFALHFHNILIYVLIGAGVVTALLGHLIDTGVIMAVVLANALIGFIQEGKAQNAMAAIGAMLAPRSAVLRDGKRRTIDAAHLTLGDIVLVEAGDRVPADMRLIEARNLKVEEAILTGESVAVEKDPAAVDQQAALGDRSPMLFSGTLAVTGTGRGVVTAIGSQTEIGHISGLLSRVEVLTTPLVQQMNIFARWLTVFILILCILLPAYGILVQGMPFDEMFMVAVGIAVAAIPEGLPAVLTITLAVGVQAMARRNAIVRRLPAIETLGSVSVICTDKTGTLTRNEMMAAALITAQSRFVVGGSGYAPTGAAQLCGPDGEAEGESGPDQQHLLEEIARIGVLCNDAALTQTGADWKVEGDPMEGALLALAGKICGTGSQPFGDFKRKDAIPFDAAYRYMAVLTGGDDSTLQADVKGAPEAVLALCHDQRAGDGTAAPLQPEYWHAMVQQLARDGQRVIALATRSMPAGTAKLESGDLAGQLTLIGLVGLIDPPRPEAIEAVSECRTAGIRVKMITGDHAATAQAIAAQIGLRNAHDVLTGADIEAMTDADLSAAVMETDVFARASPADKLRLVTALQSHGLIVAMTGDGVNDAPALKRADAGVAMGLKGSEAAREASDLVLADDNFASIAAAVREGRTVYDNITKVISWTLPTNAGESLTIILALLAGMTMPVTPVQILWVNLITGITLGIALAFEPTEKGTMCRPPRPRGAPLLSATLVWHITLVSALVVVGVFGVFSFATAAGYPVALAQTLAMNTLVVMQIFYLFFVRSIHSTSFNPGALRGTPIVWLAVVLVTAAQFAITYIPALQAIFGTQPVALSDGLAIIAVGIAFFILIEAEKQIRLALQRGAKA